MRNLFRFVVFMLACSGFVFAQAPAPPASPPLQYRDWEFTGFWGHSSTGKLRFVTPVSGSDEESSRTVEMEHAPGYQLGVRIGENVSEYWAVDLEYSFANQELRFKNLSPDIPLLELKQFIHHFTYNVSYLPLRRTKRFRPYADVGVGAGLFYITGGSKKDALAVGLPVRDSWEFVFNWGGGAKYLVMDQFSVVFDVKNRLSRVPSYGIPPTAQVVDGQFQPGMAKRGHLSNWQFNFGVTYQWEEWK